jgi:hypothetical protein
MPVLAEMILTIQLYCRSFKPKVPPNQRSDCVKTYGGVGCAIGSGCNQALPPNQRVKQF